MSSRLLCTLAAAAFTLSTPGFSQRLLLLPTSDDTTQTAGAYTLSPFAQDKLFTVGIDNIGVYQRNDVNPANVTYWVVSHAGANAVTVLDSTFKVVKTFNYGLTAGAAAMSPDGKTFILTHGSSISIYDAFAQSELQLTSNIDFGPSASDAVISQDSKTAFIFSSSAQRITAIDLASRTVTGTLSTPGSNSGYLTLGPNGLLYVTYETNFVEIDPSVTLGASAVTRKMLIGGRAGRALITPDGRRALVPNILANSSQQSAQPLLNYFNLADGTNAPATTPNELLGGQIFDQLVIASNTLAYGVATTNPRSLYQISIPQISDTTGTITAPTLTQAFFSAKGNLDTAQGLAVSGEYPASQRLYVSARLSQLSSLVPDGIYEIDVPHNTYLSTVSVKAFAAGLMQIVRPVRTTASVAPGSMLSLGVNQPIIPQQGRSRPMGVQVLGGDGLPIAGVPVTFQSSLAGVTFQGADAFGTATTNNNGYVFVEAIAPAANGMAQITASSPGITSSNNFNLTIGTGSGSGGGNGGGTGGGTTGAVGLTLVSGNGQAQSEGSQLRFPFVVRLGDAQGNPIVGAPITWTVTGFGRLLDGDLTAAQDSKIRVTLTDNNGLATQDLQPDPQVGSTAGFSQMTVDATSAAGGDVTFAATSYKIVNNADGSLVPQPSAIIQTPADGGRSFTGQAGSLIPGAIQVRFTGSGASLGQPIPNLAIEVKPLDGSAANAVTASCDPVVDALSDTTGLASCDLRFGSVVGTGNVRAVLGGQLGEVIFSITVQPGVPAAIAKVSGDAQTGSINNSLASPLVVKVTDTNGKALASQTVNWQLVSGSAVIVNNSTVTGIDGTARTTVNLGATPGLIQIRATVQGGSSLNVVFTATSTAPVNSLTKVTGDSQTAQVGAAFPTALVVQVGSTSGSLQNIPVTFSVVSGSVTLNGNASVTTSSNGQAAINVLAGSVAGPAVVRATTGSGSASFTADFNLTVAPLQIFTVTDIHNVASNTAGFLSPGGLYRIYARGVAPNLNGVQTANLLFGPLPLQMNNVTVQIGSVFVPIFQLENINGQQAVVVQAPFELTPGATDSVNVRISGQQNIVNGVPIVAAQTAIFQTLDTPPNSATTNTIAVAQHLDGSYVTAANPAKLGEQIRAYFTGAGKTFSGSFTPTTGLAGPGAPYNGDVIVAVNGVGTQIISTRYSPGYVGVWDVVFQVQSTLGAGDNSNGLATGPTQPFAIAVRPAGSSSYVAATSTIPVGK